MNINEYMAKPNKTVREHTDDLLKALEYLYLLGYLSTKHLYDLTLIACTYHDYGKGNPEFQERIHSGRKRFNENMEVAHNVLSLYFLPMEIFENETDYYRVANAVLNHHDYCDTLKVLQDNGKKELIKKLLSGFHDEIQKIGARKLGGINAVRNDKEAVLVKGFLHKCDYSASAEMQVEYPNDFLTEKLENLGYQWNDLQRFCMKNTNQNIIAIAQTGRGKTEGGLHWIGNRKGFFILPIRTAINAIYDRVRDGVLRGEKIQERVALLHSNAMEYYNDNFNSEELDLADYYERGRKLSMPLTICTMDQLFDFVFKYNGYEMKLTTLSYSKIVLDEIQMYAPDLLAYLICGIKQINEFGGKVAILTATLPPFVRDEIVEALGAEVVEGVFVDDSKRHNVKVYHKKIDAELIYQKYSANKKKNVGNKILAVCNTVKEAQQLYSELGSLFKGNGAEDGTIEMNLLHARFLKEDRAEKEKSILKFGKPPESKEDIKCESGIWIATSIVEASLDIDFDYLFTELCDLNSLFQRFGRCNRKGFKPVSEANCFVFTEVDVGKNLDQTLLELSKKEIENVEGIIDENQKIAMINECFTREKVCESEYFIKYREIKRKIERVAAYETKRGEIKLRNIMSTDIIPSEVYKKNEGEIQECLMRLEREADTQERVKIRDYIRDFTVAIPSYIVEKRKKYINSTICLSRYEKIPVFECLYDKELGFQEIDYSTYIRETNIL